MSEDSSQGNQKPVTTNVPRGQMPTKPSPFTPREKFAEEHKQKRIMFGFMVGSFVFCIVALLVAIDRLNATKLVFVVDESNTIVAGPLESLSEKQSPVFKTTALNAANAGLQLSPVGFDLPEMVRDIYAPKTIEKLNDLLKREMEEIKVKNIHQKPEIQRIEVVREDSGYRRVLIVGNLIRTGVYEGMAINESRPFKMLLVIGPNPNLTRRGQFPFIVTDFKIKQGAEVQK